MLRRLLFFAQLVGRHHGTVQGRVVRVSVRTAWDIARIVCRRAPHTRYPTNEDPHERLYR